MKAILIIIFFAINATILAQIPSTHLQLWLRADNVENISGKISQWYDLSSNNYSITQTTAVNRPTYISEGLNGQPVIQFNGTNNYLNGGDILDLGLNSNSIFIIGSHDNDPLDYFICKSIVANVPARWGAQPSRFFYQDAGGQRFVNYTMDNNKFYVISIINNRILLKDIVFSNGLFAAEGPISSSFDMSNNYNFLIGALNNATGGIPPYTDRYLKGSIAEIIIYDTLLVDSDRILVENYLMDKYSIGLELGSDINISYGLCDTALSIDPSFTNILWSTGETNDTIFINQSGQYWVQATDYFGRTRYDTINVEFPNYNLQSTTICSGDSVMYDPGLTGLYDYIWSDLSIGDTKYYKNEGDYWLRIEDSFGCFDTVFFSVNVDSFKNNIWLGNDTSLCSGNTINLINGEELCSSFLWNPGGNSESSQIVNETGWQKIEVWNAAGCYASDSVYVTVVGSAPNPDYIVENLCIGEATLFIDNSTPVGDISSWKWVINTNDTLYSQNAEWIFTESGMQNIELLVESLSGCANNLAFNIETLDIPQVNFSYLPVCTNNEMDFIPEILLPAGTSISSYSWLIDNNPVGNNEIITYNFTSAGEYQVKLIVEIDNTCSATNEKTITVNDNYPTPQNISLVLPVNGLNSTSPDIEFYWNISDNALCYKLIISQDSVFQNTIYTVDNITQNHYTYSFDGVYDTLYWKVIAYNPCYIGLESEVRLFSFFNPSALDNLELWLKADSCTVNSSLVNEWNDCSGNGNNASQISATKKPAFIPSDFSINNMPAIDFDGNNDELLGPTISGINNNSLSIFIIARNNEMPISNSASGMLSFGNYSSGGFELMRNSAGYFGYYHNGSNFNSGNIEDCSTNGTPYRIFTVKKQVGSLSEIYVNSNLRSSSNLASIISPFTNSSYRIGSFSLSPYYWNGEIAEVIVYDTALNETETSNVYQYLRYKYTPPVNLGYDIRVPYGFCDTAITTAYKPWFTGYEWSTGETDSVIHVNRPGIYTVTVTDIFGFTSSDDIRVFYPEVNDFADTIVCYGASVVWDTELEGDYGYEWYGSSELTQAITITDEGQYAAILTDTLGCKYYSDTISFSFDNYEFTASVGPTDTSLCSGNRLMLITNAGETVSYNWSTGSTNPEIVLTESGTYYVTVNNWRGCEATDNINVTITGQVPFPAFSSMGHCARNAVSFTDESTTPDGIINNWTWRVNGDIISTQQNHEYTFTEPGTYNVNLSIITDNDCGDFVTVPLIIYPLPVVSFEPEYFCQNAEAEFISTSTVNEGSVVYNLWNFDSYAVPGTPVNFSFTDEGYHNIKLISSSEMSCTDSLTKEIFVKPAEQPVYTASNTCLGEDVYFINTTPYNTVNPGENWTWDFGDGGSSSLSNPQHTYGSAGIFNTVLNIQYANKCVVSTSLPVEVYFNPEATVYPVDACEGVVFSPESEASTLSGNIISYSWNIETETPLTSVLQNPEFIIADTGSYNMSLSVLTDFGCRTTQTNTVHVHENPLAEFSASRTWGSVPLWIDFTNTGENAETYFWDFGDDEISTEENPYHIFADSGTYTVRLISTSAFGCRDSAATEIKSIIPVMDVILYNLRTEMNDNYLQTQVYVINNGTLPVNNLEMVLNLGDGKIYREVIEYLAQSQVKDYRFTLEAYIPGGNLPDVICVEAIAPAYEGNTDSDLSNNTVCNTDVENLKLMQPYPNPATEQLTCEFITARNQDITVTLVNSIGGIVYKNTLTDKEGYTKLLINVKDFVQGVYFLQVTDGNEKHSYKVEVQ